MNWKHALFGIEAGSVRMDLGLLIARIGFAGSLLLRHGSPKLVALLAGTTQFFDPIGLGPRTSLALATFAEFGCGLSLCIGLLGRLACLPLVLNFSVIVFVLHELKFPGDRGALAALYLVAFTVLFFTGPGRFSIDGLWSRRRGAATGSD